MARTVVCSNCGNEFTYKKRGRLPKNILCSNCSAPRDQNARRSKSSKSVKRNKLKISPSKNNSGVTPLDNNSTHQEKAIKNLETKKEQQTKKYITLFEPIPPSEEEKPFEPGEKLFHPSSTFPNQTPPWRFGSEIIFVEYTPDGKKKIKVKRNRNGKIIYETLLTKLELYRYKKIKQPLED